MHGRGSDYEELVICIKEVIFRKQNSTLGSIVPLAMFHMLLPDANRPKPLEKKSELSWQSLMEMIDWMFALLNSWFLLQPYSRRAFFPLNLKLISSTS